METEIIEINEPISLMFTTRNRPKPNLEWRHSAKIELKKSMTVDSKMSYFEKLRANFNIQYVDIISVDSSSNVVAKFEASEDIVIPDEDPITMYDRCAIEFYDSYIIMKVELDFERLVDFHEFTVTELGDNVRNTLEYHNENPGGATTA